MIINPSMKDSSIEYCIPTPLNRMPTNKLETKTIRTIPSNDKMPNNTVTAISKLIKTNSTNEFILVLENNEPIGHLDISDAY